jgi:hypothetical protein
MLFMSRLVKIIVVFVFGPKYLYHLNALFELYGSDPSVSNRKVERKLFIMLPQSA